MFIIKSVGGFRGLVSELEWGRSRTEGRWTVACVDIEYISLLSSSQEIAALKGKSWVSKGTLSMIVMLKLSPGGALSGTIISYSVNVLHPQTHHFLPQTFSLISWSLPFSLRFLYNEILKYQDGNEDCIFEPAEKNKLQVKPDITFHLYIR